MIISGCIQIGVNGQQAVAETKRLDLLQGLIKHLSTAPVDGLKQPCIMPAQPHQVVAAVRGGTQDHIDAVGQLLQGALDIFRCQCRTVGTDQDCIGCLLQGDGHCL